jgi:hypothetical protein
MAICASTAGIDMTQDEIIEMARQAGGIDLSTVHGGGVRVWLGTDRTEFFESLIKLAIAELESQEQNFCSRCGKRTKDLTHIHTCTPPQD